MLTGEGHVAGSGLGVRACYPPWYHKGQLSFLMSPRVRLCRKAAEITVINTGLSHVTHQIRKTSSFFFFSLFSHYQTPEHYQTLPRTRYFPDTVLGFGKNVTGNEILVGSQPDPTLQLSGIISEMF